MEPQVADSFSPEFQDCCLPLNIELQHLSWGLSCLTILCSLGFNKGSVRKYLIWWRYGLYGKDLWTSCCNGEAMKVELTELDLDYV